MVENKKPAIVDETLSYIIRFLLGEDISSDWSGAIGYTADRHLFSQYKIVILPCGFFDEPMYGTPASLPSLPLHQIEGIPLLFGSPKIEKIDDTLVVHADLIASTYFLVSRYEEMIKRDKRDEHGRFPGYESLPYRAGFIHRPIIDEYRLLLRRWLKEIHPEIPDMPKGMQRIELTHDVDAPFLYRSWKGFIRHLRDHQSFSQAIRAKFGPVEEDPYYTFPFIFEQDQRLCQAHPNGKVNTIYFIKAGGNTPQDKPCYSLKSKDMKKLCHELTKHNGTIALHSSYQAGMKPGLIAKERKRINKVGVGPITSNRHHFLTCREPEHIEALVAAGITDDYTMGYADIAGFRLGTSYLVRAINPATRKLSPLTLHPLLIMDCTLDNPKYMALGEEEALIYCLELFEQVRLVSGNLTLLWHNTSFTDQAEGYQKKLYTLLINELIRK